MKKLVLVLLIFCLLILFKSYLTNRPQDIYKSGLEITSCNQISQQDIFKLCQKIFQKDQEEFNTIMMTNAFHGHIGPNNIYGAKMGLKAKHLLNAEPHQVNVISQTGNKRPISCLNDGLAIALSLSPSWGSHDLLQIPPIEEPKLAATFYFKDQSVHLEVKPEYLDQTQSFIKASLDKYGGLTDDYFKDVRQMGLKVWQDFPQDDLFIITYPEIKHSYCHFSDANLQLYTNQLHDLIHNQATDQDILDFIDQYDCVENGKVFTKNSIYHVEAIWKQNQEPIVYAH